MARVPRCRLSRDGSVRRACQRTYPQESTKEDKSDSPRRKVSMIFSDSSTSPRRFLNVKGERRGGEGGGMVSKIHDQHTTMETRGSDVCTKTYDVFPPPRGNEGRSSSWLYFVVVHRSHLQGDRKVKGHLAVAPQPATKGTCLPIRINGTFHLVPPYHLLRRAIVVRRRRRRRRATAIRHRRRRLDAYPHAVIRRPPRIRIDVRA
jgi:hypothetical protein